MTTKAELEYFTVTLKVDKPAARAVLVTYEGDDIWLPRGHTDFEARQPRPVVGDIFELGVAGWLARDRQMTE